MKRLVFVILMTVLVGLAAYIVTQAGPKKFDGSSPEAFDTSVTGIRDSLTDGEKVAFDEDMQGVLHGLCLDDVTLFRASMNAGFSRRFGDADAGTKQDAATDVLQAAASKKLDGKTLEEFRAIAAEGRERWDERMRKALGDDSVGEVTGGAGSISTPRELPPAATEPVTPVGSLEDLLSEIDSIDTVVREFESNRVSYRIDVPTGTTIKTSEYTDSIELILPSGESGTMYAGQYSVIDRFDNEHNVIVRQELIVVRERSNDSVQKGLLAKMNVRASKWRWFHIDVEGPGGLRKPLQRPAALSLLRAAKSLRLQTPDPEDPVKLLGALAIEFAPKDAATVEDVTTLTLNALQHLEVLELFPNLREVKIEDIEFQNAEVDLEHVWKCGSLVSLDLAPSLTPRMVARITNDLQNLESVTIDPGKLSRQDLEVFSKLPSLHTIGFKALPEDKNAGFGLTTLAQLKCLRLANHAGRDFEFLASLTVPEIALKGATPEMIETAAGNQNLTSVTLDTRDSRDLKHFARLPELRHLSVRIGGDGENLSAKLFRGFAKSKLESLELSVPYLKGSPDEGTTTAISEIKGLKKLRFRLSKPSRETIVRFLDMPNLRELSADRYPAFEWDEFEKELQKRPHIKFQ